MKQGDIIEVQVKEIHPGYIKIDYQGRDATLQIVDLTWKPGPVNPDDFVSVGDCIKVKVTKVVDDRFSVSLKEALPGGNPWLNPPRVGQVYRSKVSVVTEYGAFFDITSYCRALLHIDNMNKQYKVGDIDNVKVKYVDVERQRVELILAGSKL